MCTPLIIYLLLFVAGQELLRAYPLQMRKILQTHLSPKGEFIQQLIAFFKSKKVLKEPYNKDELLNELPQNDEDRMVFSGANVMFSYIQRINDVCQ